MTESLLVENSEALIGIFGRWPSFHDAEVLSVHLDRAGDDAPSLEARVHVFRMTNDVDDRGFFVLTKHTLVTLRFSNIILRYLRWFNDQNSLSSLGIEQVDPAENEGRTLGASFDSNYGVELDVLCDRITVRSVEPFTPAE